MVTILRQKYANLKKVTAELCDHRQLGARFEGPYDIFISAFSFNYAFDQNVGDYDAFLEKIVLANLKAQSQVVSVELPFRLLLNNMETCQMENDLILLKPWQGIVVETENAFS